MKKIIILAAILISFNGLFAQNAVKTKDGNYIALKATGTTKDSNKQTGKTFTDTKGVKYPVMESAKGKLFYVKTSKTGNEYKVYIKLN